MEDKDNGNGSQTQYRGIRRRRWGKWVSEIRVPGSRDRLWLGSFSTPEAAAFAHDVAFYCLHRPPSLHSLNFPHMLPTGVASHTSPRSIQRAASDAGMALDAQFVLTGSSRSTQGTDGEPLSISVYDYLDDDSL